MSEDGKSDDMMQASGASSLDVSRVAHYQKWKDASRYSNMPRKVNAQPEGAATVSENLSASANWRHLVWALLCDYDIS
jgi:hypothetical protein